MIKTDTEKLAGEVIPLLHEMFGEGIDFEYTTYFKSNEALSGIALKMQGCSNIPVVCLNDMPDGISAKDAANIAATGFQEVLHNYKELPVIPEMTREYVLENVVLQALSRKRNRQLLKVHPHLQYLDLAGIFRVPLGAWEKNSLSTILITNQIAEKLGLTSEDLTEAARRNTIEKFGIELENTRRMALRSLLKQPSIPENFEDVQIEEPGLYTLTNQIHINGAALMLIPDILEQLGEKAGMDYYILPSSIHELLIARDDGLVTARMLKELIHEGNRTEGIIKSEDVLSDNVYFYSRRTKSLKIV